MKNRKHFAFHHAGDWQNSYICLCSRVNNHMAPQLETIEQPTLFELAHSGEMVMNPSF